MIDSFSSNATEAVVAIPAKDEEDFLKPCLDAVLGQTVRPDVVLLLLNNCRDNSLAYLKTLQGQHPELIVAETDLPPPLACAGAARRVALNLAAAFIKDGVLLTTDADSVVPLDWVARNLAEIRNGADMVCGQAQLLEMDRASLPVTLHLHEAREAQYLAVLDEIAAMMDPDPADCWPRHQQHSGASMAMTISAYRRAGGVPMVRFGEDRALAASFRRVDARIRHAPDIFVGVSGRLEGRAEAGMAATLRRRMEMPDKLADDLLEPLPAGLHRLRARKALRLLWAKGGDGRALARALRVPPRALHTAVALPYFGAAWERLQSLSPALRRVPMPMSALAAQTRMALRVRDDLRASYGRAATAKPSAKAWRRAG
ncbi:MAG: glycosyltransferase [Rhodospirillales bacterium]|nr:glycosyltransferase [Rhodospirillales bacterium]